jgi:hypothetical protein
MRPCAKVPYSHAGAAVRALHRIKRSHRGGYGIDGLQPYRCPRCGSWHLGHR